MIHFLSFKIKNHNILIYICFIFISCDKNAPRLHPHLFYIIRTSVMKILVQALDIFREQIWDPYSWPESNK